MAMRSGGSAKFTAADATANANAKSTDGSTSFMPPTVATYISRPARLTPVRNSRTARVIAQRAESSPLVTRRAFP